MGKRGLSKAATALWEVEERLGVAKLELSTAQREGEQRVAAAQGRVTALQESYDLLKVSLAPTKRGSSNGSEKSSVAPATAPPARQRSSRARSVASSPPPTEGLGEPAGTASNDDGNSKEVVQ